MLTLADIDALYPETHDGSIFSDLYKDVYGFRPRGITFASIQEFEEREARLVAELADILADKEKEQKANVIVFEDRVTYIQALVLGCTKKRAVHFIMDAEEIYDDQDPYGYLEYHFNLPYGYIKNYLKDF